LDENLSCHDPSIFPVSDFAVSIGGWENKFSIIGINSSLINIKKALIQNEWLFSMVNTMCSIN
jgi:hypothetical protein